MREVTRYYDLVKTILKGFSFPKPMPVEILQQREIMRYSMIVLLLHCVFLQHGYTAPVDPDLEHLYAVPAQDPITPCAYSMRTACVECKGKNSQSAQTTVQA